MTQSPILRLAISLALLGISVLMLAKFLGIVPDTRQAELEARQVVAESLAVQVSSAIAKDELHTVTRTFRAVVSRNQSVVSVGLREKSGDVLAQAGNHEQEWKSKDVNKSTANEVIVPLFEGAESWGAMEVQFEPIGRGSHQFLGSSYLATLLFFLVVGFAAFYLFLTRTFRELNPNSVIPERVRSALDTLSDGVLIIDSKENIAFANSTFVEKLGMSGDELLGLPAEELNWTLADSVELPWVTVLCGGKEAKQLAISLETPVGHTLQFVLNATAIRGGENKPVRGVMVTFDDVTELEKKNSELRHALERLESNEKEIRRQNRELQELATRDPLTGCLNRRSFFKGFKKLFKLSQSDQSPLSCLMVDIDHFKSINDNYGHGVGDRVIKNMAQLLRDSARPDDLVSRYGTSHRSF